ncbi:MAG: N-6 DNA methylase [Candidatus Diapherotrites archaeon]|nr:N-6 DNA methylase [Candidatus Diapherotrites archaeon]
MSSEAAQQRVQGLVDKFQRVMDEGKLKTYSEERTKNEFIEPLFEALGWDMRNERTDDEVIKEQRVLRGRADYAFRLGGVIRFFVEAKGAKVNLDDTEFAKQAISYGFNKGVTWAVLTDFEGLKVFNCEWNEANIWRNQVFELRYTQFLNEFDKLWLLSKESFDKNALGDYASTVGKRTPRKSVAELLLKELLVWREALSKDIKKAHPDKYLQEEIDEIVQRVIDRLIFIRACEDRQIEGNKLKEALNAHREKGRSLSRELNEIFDYYREHYDSKLFGRTADEEHEADKVKVSDRILDGVIDALYYSTDGNVRYDFALIDSDVLGNIYEQYLGTVLQTTAKRAKLSEGKSHRKEQGIYYTPTYIVDYIVKNTLGELIKKKKPADVDKIRVLDPACGSGSFLIKAFDVLDEYYAKNDKDYAQAKLGGDGARITKKIEILKNNIHGVDLDEKAVEIAQLNLLLKMAEKRHLLPSLESSIKCGNSLIDDPKVAGDKAFDWNKEFKNVMKDGGFDVVIGNPPYVRQEELLPIKPFLEKGYEVYHSMADLFVYFFERELKLLKEGGYFGMIVSNKWLKAGYGERLREFLGNYWVEEFIDFGDLKVFEDATTYPCIIVIRNKKKQNPKTKVCLVRDLNFDSLEEYVKKNSFTMNQKNLDKSGWNFQPEGVTKVLEKTRKDSLPLSRYISDKAYFGIKTGLTKAFVISKETKNQLTKEDSASKEIIYPFLMGKEVRPYVIHFDEKYIILTKIGVDIQRYPAVYNWLKQFKPELEKRWDKGEHWYELRACDYYDKFKKPKLIYGAITTGPRFTLDTDGYFANNANFFIPTEDLKLLAILNSKLGWFLISNTCTQIRGGYQLIWKYFGNVPIAKKESPELEKLAKKMLSLNKRLVGMGDKQTDERKRLEKEIAETDAKIDGLVYGLYGLTKEEREIVEKSGR